AEAPVVNAEHRDFVIADHAGGGDHRAVAAEDEHQIDLAGDVFALDLRDRTAGLVLNPLALEIWATNERDAALRKPDDEVADGL
ncbi:MAG TPA: hypothetical protein VN659_10045, partial [Pyrinomonadaceae bacterium]|nr:hypothetical protein [Pyrinomonadaceae bacterium]